jgi:hypothetical protein
MVNSTILGYVTTLIDARLDFFFDTSTAAALTTNTSGSSMYIISSQFLAYAGAVFAFVFSFLGALQVAE